MSAAGIEHDVMNKLALGIVVQPGTQSLNLSCHISCERVYQVGPGKQTIDARLHAETIRTFVILFGPALLPWSILCAD